MFNAVMLLVALLSGILLLMNVGAGAARMPVCCARSTTGKTASSTGGAASSTGETADFVRGAAVGQVPRLRAQRSGSLVTEGCDSPHGLGGPRAASGPVPAAGGSRPPLTAMTQTIQMIEPGHARQRPCRGRGR